MDFLIKALLITHVSAGFTSLGLFFIPAIARKGSKLHNTVGRWYVFGMWTVLITALLLCMVRVINGQFVQAMFLGFLALLTSQPLYYGVAVLRNKQGASTRMRRVDLGLRLALAIFGPYLIGAGLGWWGPQGHQLLVIFGVLGTVISVPSVIDNLRGKQKDYNWLMEHVSGLIISAIAAFTAFFAFGGRQIFGDLFAGNLQIVAWVAPTIIGVSFLRYYKWNSNRKKGLGKKSMPTLILLFVATASLSAQLYVEQQTRHRFAQMTVGVEYQMSTGGQAVFFNDGNRQELPLGNLGGPRLLIGGTHFWGHADFYVALPITTSRFSQNENEVSFLVGGETGFKVYPWRIEKGRLRPYLGGALIPYSYRQDNQEAFGRGPAKDYLAVPLKGGFTFSHQNLLLEAGFTWNYASRQNYPVSRQRFEEVTLPPLFFNLALKYQFDTTIGAEEDWESGRTELVTDKLVEKGLLSDFYVAAGPSSVWWNGTSSYNEINHPSIDGYPAGIMPDFGLGYHFHKPDINVALAFRNMTGGATSYGVVHELRRRSLGLEVTKSIGDYHGFTPFIGPIISREHLRFSESINDELVGVVEVDKWAAGLTFGWDIRPNRIQYFTLRTNLRWYPKLRLDIGNQSEVSFGAVEFNFIQLVVYPERIF